MYWLVLCFPQMFLSILYETWRYSNLHVQCTLDILIHTECSQYCLLQKSKWSIRSGWKDFTYTQIKWATRCIIHTVVRWNVKSMGENWMKIFVAHTHTRHTQIMPINTASMIYKRQSFAEPLIQFIVCRLELLACIIFYCQRLLVLLLLFFLSSYVLPRL